MAEFAAHGANQEEKMAAEKAKKTIVIGHKNPDTDSICSAIGYANFKTLQTGGEYVPCRAGELNPETTFVLDYFKVDVPKLIKSVKTQVKDVEIRETPGVSKNISLRKAWNLMQEDGLVTLPAVTDKNILEGLITVGDITRSYMNVYDSSILSKACTQYANIIETLEGAIFVGDEKAYFDKGKVLIAAANPDMMEYYIEENDLVILGNRYESQLCAIEMGASCIIVCEGAGVSMTIKKLAQERGCTVITTPYDTYTAARLINQSMPISYFMKTEKLITFDTDDFIDDIKDVMASKRFRHFPVLDKEGKYKLGIWVRDDTQGIGTLTYVDEDGRFGALGHGISDVDTGELLSIADGNLYDAQILGIRKGEKGNPGELSGLIRYDADNILGEISENSKNGIFGIMDAWRMKNLDLKKIPIGYKQDLKTGPASILCCTDGEVKEYAAEITRIDMNHEDSNKSFVIRITDKELLEKTGGIVQGMSGSPVLQNGKLFGAVTHVFVQDSTGGYGIFIENMTGNA